MDLSVFDRFEVKYNANDIIFCEFERGDSFYLIKSGRVSIVKIIGDVEKIIDILEPGEFFGEMAILENAPRSANAIAHDDCALLEFNKENFEVLMKGQPQLALNLLKLFSKRIYDQKRRFMILTLPDEITKVADVFLMLIEKDKRVYESEFKRELEISSEDIAHWAGISEEACAKALKSLTAQRRIEVFDNKIVVKNITELTRFVAGMRRHRGQGD